MIRRPSGKTALALLACLTLMSLAEIGRADEDAKKKSCQALQPAGPGNATISIATGSPTGLYQYTAQRIKLLMEEADESAPRLEVLHTGGSGDNVDKLLAGEVEMAIVQSDILFGRLEEIESCGRADGEIFAIASLFPEYTQIMVAHDSDVENVIQLAGRRLFLGSIGSGTEVNAKMVLGLAGIDVDGYEVDNDGLDFERVNPDLNSTEAMELLCRGPAAEEGGTDGASPAIDAVFRVTGSIFPKLDRWQDCLKLVSLDTELISAILGEYPYYGLTRVQVGDQEVDMLYTRAVLVARGLDSKLRDEQITALTALIVEKLPAAFQKGKRNQNAVLFRGAKTVAGLPIDFHPEARKHYEHEDVNLLKSNRWKWMITALLLWVTIAAIKMHTGSRTQHEQWFYARHSNFVNFLYEITAGQFEWLLALIGRSLASLGRSVRDFSFFKSPITVAVWFLLIFLWIALLTILHFESMHALTRDIPNQFDNIEFRDLWIWLLQVLSLGESPDGLFPKSAVAKAVTVIIPIIGVVGAILAVLMATIREKSAKERRARGLDIQPLSKHLVLCGWNEHGKRVIEEISTDVPGTRRKKIALVAESDREKPLEEWGLARENAHYLRGMSSDSANLERVNASRAAGFLVLAGERKIRHRNFRSIFTVKMISRQIEHLPPERRPRIMVDMVFKENLDMFRVAGADRVLNTRLIGTVFLAYSALNMGFSNVITSLMSLATRPVITRINAADRRRVFSRVIGQNFSKAWATLFKEGINLLAIVPHEGETSPTIGIYPDLPNPMIIGEDDLVIARGDSLIILENQALRNKKVSAVSFADSHTDVQNGLDHDTPLVVIDRRHEAADELRRLLEKRCTDLYYICGGRREAGQDDTRFIHWDGRVDSISGLVEQHVLDDLQRNGKQGKIKFLIPTVENPLNYSSANAVHQDDDTVALILQLKTLDTERFHFTAEIQSLENLRLFKGVGVQQPIPVHEFASLALTKMVLFDGEVTGLILRFMENFFTGELENKSLRKIALSGTGIADRLVGQNYAGAAQLLFREGIQLLAIISHDGVDQRNRLVALPYRKDPDYGYRINPDDELFVIS
ncbi:MAG: TAXI family TRAP transporter solute-binding subunit [Xanthomonadales bacterium]|nr:TAXI family TRAP transporter solute-binding subunit [Xanthomonadales bacterium]